MPRTPSMSFQQCWWLERTRLVNVIALKRHVSRLIIIVHVLQFVGVDLLSACTISSCWLSWWRYSLCNISSTQFDATKRRTHWLNAVIHFYGESQEDVSIITSSIVTWKETVRELTPAENSMGMRMRWVWRWWCKYCNDKKNGNLSLISCRRVACGRLKDLYGNIMMSQHRSSLTTRTCNLRCSW